MTITQDNLAVAAAVVAMVAFLSANGVFMLINPLAWYELVPGVTDTGFFNQHFIRDIGLIQLFIGVAFAVGMLVPERRIGLWQLPQLGSARMRSSTSGRSRSASAHPRSFRAIFQR